MDSATTDTAIVPPLKTQDENPSGDTGDNCPVCFDAIGTRGMVRTACGHAFCFGCFESFIVRSNSCPLCRTKVMGENSALDKCIRPSGTGEQNLFTEAAARDLASDIALILLDSGNEKAPHLMRSFNLDTTSDRSAINRVARRVVDEYSAITSRLADDIIFGADWRAGGREAHEAQMAQHREAHEVQMAQIAATRREREATQRATEAAQRAIREREAAELQAAEAAKRRARDERFRNDPGSGRAWCVRCSTKILINRDGTLRRHSPCGPGMAPYNHTPSVLSLQ